MGPSIEPIRTSAGATVGAVAIGRNEGARLIGCLRSLRPLVNTLVYVDSGSTDGSADAALNLGASVEVLDLAIPFTAARARNAGFRRLLQLNPAVEFVFFVDGDCEVQPGWVALACAFLASHPECAVVWGRRREKHPDQSIYNLLCDIEWGSASIGASKACGGDAVMRVPVFSQVGGFREDFICGEEPELCVRIRRQGWGIWHLDAEMTLHDAAIYRFGQWWQRMVRGGYCFAQGAALHGKPPERHWVRESRRAWLWGLGIPLFIALMTLLYGPIALALMFIYVIQLVRLARAAPTLTRTRTRWLWAGAMIIARFPEMLGQLKYGLDRIRQAEPRLIEYK